MAFLDRLHKIAVAAGGATKSVMGFVLGMPAASFKDDEYDSFIGDIYGNVVSHAKDISGAAIGPTGVGAQVFGAVPESIRHPVRSVTTPVFGALETGYREAIAEPLSTYFTTLSQADSEGGQKLFSPSAWAKSYRIAQHRSPGQSLAIGLSQTNPLDEAEVAKFAGTDAYKIMSGVSDAVARTFLDPTVIAGKVGTSARLKYVTQPITSATDIAAVAGSRRVATFNDALTSIKREHTTGAAAVIRDRFFPDHDAGALISTVLAEAKTPVEQFSALQALMGDKAALNSLRQQRSLLHEPIASLNRAADQLGPIKALEPPTGQGTLFGTTDIGIPGDVAAIRDEVATYYNWEGRLARIEKGFASIRTVPKAGPVGELRTNITRSDFYQNTSLGKTLQTFFHMNAHPVANLTDPRSDIHIHRMMQEAELPLDVADTFRAEYMAAPDDASRLLVANNAERAAIEHLTARAKMSPEEVESILNDIAKGKGEAQNLLTKRVFNEDGSSVLTHQDINGEWVDTYFPSWVTQESTLLPLINMRELKSATEWLGQHRAKYPAANIPGEVANAFTRIWKPAVLLRPAWPLRVVSDEQFRIIAKIGALSHLDNLQTGLRDYTQDFLSVTREEGLRQVAGRGNRPVREVFGVRKFNYRGHDMEGVFGTPDDVRRDIRLRTSSARSWEAFVGDAERFELKEMRTAGANFKSVSPDHADYPALYDWAVDHLRKQPIAARLLAGENVEDILTFLHSTPEGSDILRANTVRAHNARNWVEDIEREVTKYTADNPELRSLIASGKASHADLARLVPDIESRPVAHGEALLQATNQGYISRRIGEIVERTFDKLGRLPTDTFSRNPFMGHMYRQEVSRQLDLIGDAPIDNVLKRQIEENARGFALNETQKLLYDLAEQSRFGEMLNFLSPFYNAWQEVITRWTGLAIENPVFAARARLIWRAPEKMGLVTDENGREIMSGDIYSDDPDAPNYRGKDRLIHLPLPDWVSDIPGMKGLEGKNAIAFNKKSFNLVLQGLPSVGPLVSIPINQIVKDRPELADNVKFALPFGPTHDLESMILPSSAKYFLSAKDQDEKYANTLLRIYMDQIVDYNLGKRDTKPTYADAKAQADAFVNLRGFSAMVMPAAPIFQSPYQTHIDAFRQAQARYAEDKNSLADSSGNVRTPDEYFLDTYGKEYFALTQAVSKSVNGVPPTLDAWMTSKENQALIEEFPELGGLIVGADGGGEFNSAVYNAQKNTRLAPGSAQNQRESIPFDEASIGPDRRLGWIEYRRAMDMIESTRIQRGLPNLQVAAAQDLAQIKSALTQYLGDKYPAWKEDFNQTDKGKWENKINALTRIANDPKMKDRPDMAGIREYLSARSMMNKALEDRVKQGGAKTLSASSNTDLAQTWNNITGYLVEKNLAFGDVFYRHLENDPLGL